MSPWQIILITIALILLTSRVSAQDTSETTEPDGTIEFCNEEIRKFHFQRDSYPDALLPGKGWDNLENKEMTRVIDIDKHFECKTSNDWRYFVPDSMDVVAQPDETNAEAATLDSPARPVATNAYSINSHDGIPLENVVARGAFSTNFLRYREKLAEGKLVPVLVQFKYKRYKSRLTAGLSLTSEAKTEFGKLLDDFKYFRLEHTRYRAEALVKKFGTHVVTEVHAGDGLQEALYVKRHMYKARIKTEADRERLVSEIVKTFLQGISRGSWLGAMWGIMRVAGSGSYSTTDGMKRSDGSIFNYFAVKTVDQFKEEADVRLIVLERIGKPLHSVLTIELFPTTPPRILDKASELIQNVIETYYQLNTHAGCTDHESFNFSPSSNYDDGSCNVKAKNLNFGGVFLKCTRGSNQDGTNEPACAGKNFVHPITMNYSCPADYVAVQLYRNLIVLNELRAGSDASNLYITVEYSWCFAARDVNNQSGFIFGGISGPRFWNYLKAVNSNCPKQHFEMPLIPNYNVCMSQFRGAIGEPFGGFYSSKIGNPLAAKEAGVENFATNWSLWPKRCPTGYSAVPFAAIEGDYFVLCAIRSKKRYPEPVINLPIRKPYFTPKPPELEESSAHIEDDQDSGGFSGANLPATGAAAVLGILGTMAALSMFLSLKDVVKALEELEAKRNKEEPEERSGVFGEARPQETRSDLAVPNPSVVFEKDKEK